MAKKVTIKNPAFEAIVAELLKTKLVRVAGLGTFKIKKAMSGYNPTTKKPEKRQYIKISFTPSETLKAKAKQWNTKK